MKIEIDIPIKASVVNGGMEVEIALLKESWSEKQLKGYANDKGVYVIHHDNKIKYVGKTDSENMDFGKRLRRTFREGSGGNSTLKASKELMKLKREKGVVKVPVYFLGLDDVNILVESNDINLKPIEKISILEPALIQTWKPEWNKI